MKLCWLGAFGDVALEIVCHLFAKKCYGGTCVFKLFDMSQVGWLYMWGNACLAGLVIYLMVVNEVILFCLIYFNF